MVIFDSKLIRASSCSRDRWIKLQHPSGKMVLLIIRKFPFPNFLLTSQGIYAVEAGMHRFEV